MTQTLTPVAEAGDKIEVRTTFVLKAVPSRNVLNKHNIKVDKAVNSDSELAYGQVDVLVSNAGVDRYGDRIKMQGIKEDRFLENPVVLWSHNHSDLPIGQVVKIWDDGVSKYARIQFDVDGVDDFAEKVYIKMLTGFIRAVSIGGLVLKYGVVEENAVTYTDYSDIQELEWLELSVCSVGAHPDALVTAKRYGFTTPEDLTSVQKFMSGATIETKSAEDVSRFDQIEKSVEALTAQQSALRSSVEALRVPDQATAPAAVKKHIRKRKLVSVKTAVKNVDKLAEQTLSLINAELEKEFPNVRTTRNTRNT